jgi:hypothetical protein
MSVGESLADNRCANCPGGATCPYWRIAPRICELARTRPAYAAMVQRGALASPAGAPSSTDRPAGCSSCSSGTGAPAATEGFPSLGEQAGNVLAAAGRFLASGLKLAVPAEVERRLAICRACPRLDAQQSRCLSCGCWVATKTRLGSESCPEGRWKW